jgi:hypothetical protein
MGHRTHLWAGSTARLRTFSIFRTQWRVRVAGVIDPLGGADASQHRSIGEGAFWYQARRHGPEGDAQAEAHCGRLAPFTQISSLTSSWKNGEPLLFEDRASGR